jgi:hypothetical protein
LCFVSCFFYLRLFLAPLMFRAFHLASPLTLCCCYLRWCVISHLALLFVCFGSSPSPCITITCVVLCFVFSLFVLVIRVVLCHYLLGSLALHCHYLLWFFTLHCCCLLWYFTLHCWCLLWSFAFHYCCWLYPLPCIIISCYGSPPSLCFVAPHLFQILTSSSFVLLLLAMVCHSSPCVIATCLLK